MKFDNLLLDIEDRIATITINRPEVRNALDGKTWGEMSEALDALEADAEVGAIIITGAGEKSFAAGADIRQLNTRTLLDGLNAPTQKSLIRLEAIEKPVIAAINGFALGGGCELAMACDIRIASERAKLGQPEVNLGIIPGAGGTQRLASLVGLGKAKELILTGDIIDAREAERIGLVNKVVPHEDLIEAAREMARKILSKGPLAIRLAKVALNARVKWGPEAGMIIERLAQACLMTTEDMVEGTGAFLEKRKAEFKGR
ncbi:MAG: enoyl-CoA hydratase-related protein [bacterium]